MIMSMSDPNTMKNALIRLYSATHNIDLLDNALNHYIITADEYIEITGQSYDTILDKLKAIKILDSKVALNQWFIDNPMPSCIHNGTDALYTVTKEKRDIFASNLISYQFLKDNGVDTTFKWNSTSNECEEWTHEEVVAFTEQMTNYVALRVAEQQAFEVLCNACESDIELTALTVNYVDCPHTVKASSKDAE